MMHHLHVIAVLLVALRNAGVQAQSAVWKFPTAGNPLQANYNDVLLLDYTSTLPNTILRMWCSPDGGDQTLVSSFYVASDGPFSYVLNNFSDQTGFPLSCHAALAADPLGDGVDSPAGIAFSSDTAQAVKTIAQNQAAISNIVTTTLAGPTVYITTTNPGATSTSSTSISTASLSKSTTLSTSTSTGSSSGIAAASQSSTFIYPSSPSSPSKPSKSNNTGPIVGGVLGGVALISFVALGLLFLGKYRRNHASSPVPTTTQSPKPAFSLFGFFQKQRGEKVGIASVHEVDGGTGRIYEKDGSPLHHSPQGAYEAPGDTAAFELPADSNRLP